jgi:putative tryptophan/tyrosine transport system substrate-binding protein
MKTRLARCALALALLAGPVGAKAQQPAEKVLRIGWLTPGTGTIRESFRKALYELGYIEGRTISFEVRGAGDNLSRLPMLAAELVEAKVDIIVAVSLPAIEAAHQATRTIPIVMAFGGAGLLESGIVASLARPGGNVTGVHLLATELDGKRLELLLQAVPKANKVGVLNPALGYHLTEVARTAQAAKASLYVVDVPIGAQGYDRAFDLMVKARVGALLVPASPRFSRDGRWIADLAAKHRIPAMYEWGYLARAGGLLAYGPTNSELDRRSAAFVDKILKGAKPADLPVEQPTKFELVINLKTAKALNLTIPPSVLARADEVIQ